MVSSGIQSVHDFSTFGYNRETSVDFRQISGFFSIISGVFNDFKGITNVTGKIENSESYNKLIV